MRGIEWTHRGTSRHIEERAEIFLLEGMPEELAIREAVKQMGAPDDIGLSLHQIHKPKFDWIFAVIVALLTVVGLFGMYTVQNSSSTHKLEIMFFENKAIYVGIGLLLLVVCYFLDFRKSKEYSSHIFTAVLFLMLYTQTTGITINGSSQGIAIGPFTINIMVVSLFPLTFALAGMKPAR